MGSARAREADKKQPKSICDLEIVVVSKAQPCKTPPLAQIDFFRLFSFCYLSAFRAPKPQSVSLLMPLMIRWEIDGCLRHECLSFVQRFNMFRVSQLFASPTTRKIASTKNRC